MRTNQMFDEAGRVNRGRGDDQGHHRGGRAAETRSDCRIGGYARSDELRAPRGGQRSHHDSAWKARTEPAKTWWRRLCTTRVCAKPNRLSRSTAPPFRIPCWRASYSDTRKAHLPTPAAQKRGIFELADKGTLFLDEIGEIPLMLQAKLLRVLEEQSFRRLGGLKDIKLDLRVVAATNKNLREAVKEGAFRQDLYFRLNVIQILIPPLRDRAGRHRAADALFRRSLQSQVQTEYRRDQRTGSQTPDDARLAGQCARTAERHRARHDSGGIRDDHGRQPAHRDFASRSQRWQ